MHRHYCPVVGHNWPCDDPTCECICGVPMEQAEHDDCPVELRACAAHPEDGFTAEANPDAVAIDFGILSPENRAAKTKCNCGCAEIDAADIVGWCMWCSHVYSAWSPAIANEHFANGCPGVPEPTRAESLARFGKPLFVHKRLT
jgi:hypothetical protein